MAEKGMNDIVLYGAIGLAGWWAYSSGWFDFILPPTMASGAPPTDKGSEVNGNGANGNGANGNGGGNGTNLLNGGNGGNGSNGNGGNGGNGNGGNGTSALTPADEPVDDVGVRRPPTRSRAALSVKRLVLDAGGPAPKNFWQWNYYWTQVTGGTGAPDPRSLVDFQGMSTAEIEATALTVDQWWSYMGQFGLSGRGLGARASLPTSAWVT